MCVAPIRAPSTGDLVGCGGCWQCQSSKEWDWVGRCIAEAQYSDHVRFMTLTYAGDHPHVVVFRKDHVQRMIRSLRDAGYKVRYLVTGEYGAAKGRTHWHAILFFRGAVPDMELTSPIGRGHMFDWKFWPYGKTVAKVPDPKAYRYVIKYMFKDPNREQPYYINPQAMMSKKPPLGDEFITQFAADLVEAGLPLSAPEYRFAGVRQSKSKGHRRFWLQGKSRENLMSRYVEMWRERHGTEPPPSDYLMEHHFDKIARAEMDADPGDLAGRLEAKRPKISERKLREETFISDAFDPYGANVQPLGLLMIRHGDQVGSVEAFSDGSARLQLDAGPDYQLGRGTFGQIEAQLRGTGLRPRNVRRVARWLADHWGVPVPGVLPRPSPKRDRDVRRAA